MNSSTQDKPLKFNIFLGEFINKLTNSPTIQNISKELFSIKKKDYILINDNISLPEIAQNLLDDVVLQRDEIIKILNNIFSVKFKYNADFYKYLLETNLFVSIISTGYEYILEDYFFDLINKNTPFSINNDEIKKISYYKIYGDLKNSEKFVLSTQDIKRIKILNFYENFWNKIRKDLCTYPTIIFGANFNDNSFMGILDFILSKIKDQHNTLYIYTDEASKSAIAESFIKKYSINIIEGKSEDFFINLEKHFPEFSKINREGDAPHLGYA